MATPGQPTLHKPEDCWSPLLGMRPASPGLPNKTYAATPSALRIDVWKWTSDGSLRP